MDDASPLPPAVRYRRCHLGDTQQRSGAEPRYRGIIAGRVYRPLPYRQLRLPRSHGNHAHARVTPPLERNI